MPSTTASESVYSEGSHARLNSSKSVLSFAHLSYQVGTKDGVKKLIDDVSVEVKAGELLAIMVCLPGLSLDGLG
jgi:ABC-type glutathione transport system ATPase component